MKKRRLLSVILAVSLLIVSSAVGASAVVASPPLNVDEMAVYLNEGFYGHSSAIINGSMYAAEGDVEFDNSGNSHRVDGNIYLKNGNEFIIPNKFPLDYHPDFENRVFYLPTTHFDESFPVLADFPTISNYVASYTSTWYPVPAPIDEDTHFGNLMIQAPITIDVTAGDVVIVADTLSFGGNGKFNLVGDNRLFLFVENYSGTGTVQINNGNNPDKTYIVSKKSLANTNAMHIYAHVYYTGMATLLLNGTITGSVATDATSITISMAAVNGIVYAPYADAIVRSPLGTNGGVSINGRIVAKSLDLSNNGKIVYVPCELVVPPQLLTPLAPQTYTVTVQSNASGRGVVSPTSVTAESGDIVNIKAMPNTGYTFSHFESSNSTMIPDASGNITVSGNVTITAYFFEEAPLVPGYKNGLLGAYYDSSILTNESALKIKRIDPNIAFNGGYDTTPDPVIELETFSMRWTGFIRPTVSGDYTFKTYSDDGVKVIVNGTTLIDKWGLLSLDYTVASQTISLQAGVLYPITVEYQQMPLYAACILFWEAPGVLTSIVPSSAFYVQEATYNEYTPAQYFNPLEKGGAGFTNSFYRLRNNQQPQPQPKHTEINNVDYRWGWDAPENIEDDSFYAEMSGYLEAKYTEDTTLWFSVDDGIRVWLEDVLVIDEWDYHDVENFEYTFNATAGHKYKILIEYIDFGLGATCVMGWEGEALESQIVPAAYMYAEL